MQAISLIQLAQGPTRELLVVILLVFVVLCLLRECMELLSVRSDQSTLKVCLECLMTDISSFIQVWTCKAVPINPLPPPFMDITSIFHTKCGKYKELMQRSKSFMSSMEEGSADFNLNSSHFHQVKGYIFPQGCMCVNWKSPNVGRQRTNFAYIHVYGWVLTQITYAAVVAIILKVFLGVDMQYMLLPSTSLSRWRHRCDKRYTHV